MTSSSKVINRYIKKMSNKKWEIINVTDKGIQVKKIRKFNMLGFWIGLILLPFWGIGIAFWILAIIDYLWQYLKGDKIKFITIDQMTKQLKANSGN